MSSIEQKIELPRLVGVYVHLPYCDVKCAYCDFFSVAARHVDDEFWRRYLQTLRSDLAQQLKLVHDDTQRPVLCSIFFGGGTPSKAPGYVVRELIQAIRSAFKFQCNDLEISAEANPESLNPTLLAQWRQAGVNRVSVGLQSLEEKVLRYLGRLYRPRAYASALRLIREAGFTNYNADFITGVPGQSVASTLNDLRFALGEGVTHISLYQLTVEPGTLLKQRIARGELPQLQEKQQLRQMRAAANFLKSHGFERYEISNFARPGYRCLHNLLYWTQRPYLGLGVGAHSYTGKRRFYHPRSLEKYFSATNNPTQDTATHLRDGLIGYVRLVRPVHAERILRLFSQAERPQAERALRIAEAKGWIVRRNRLLGLTPRGIEQNDSLLASLWGVGA